MELLELVTLKFLRTLWTGLRKFPLGDIKMVLFHTVVWIISKSFYVATAILLLFAPVGTLEVYNHLKGGDSLRPWVLTEHELARLKLKEIDLQSCEQDYARARMLDELDGAPKPESKGTKNGKETNETQRR
jgi:hypothetical protein